MKDTTRREVIAVRHVAFEDLGLFEEVLTERGFRVRYVDVARDHLLQQLRESDPSLLVLLGGPVSAYEDESYPFLKAEKALVRDRVARRRPLLGICLGAQVIASALGARVYPARPKEIGWAPVQLTEAGAGSPLGELTGPVLHWHGDTFDLPEGAIHLASTPAYRNQAFALGPHVLGVQFHPEVSSDAQEPWLVGHAHEIAHTPGVTAIGLRAAAREQAGIPRRQGRLFFGRWLDCLTHARLLE
ncbi:MAG TPA: glutamine amidotransferase [Actinophytocola sp.]|uniref:glutamine amidotransferase n=1 Tax=Actinophytocola sp. TaxID=1872138 RepID=UPI002DDDB017|nr:glutamine amidotransferase [Actinophytocola sp.]HEV2780893.1 glutamine amidotransferase [Actinophytocola sp.]